MNPERIFTDVVSVMRDYIVARSSKGDGKTMAVGMTFVSPDDKRVEELARLLVESILRHDDGRRRCHIEARALRLGDHFTRYAIKDGVGVDEEVVVMKTTTASGRTTVRYRRNGDLQAEVSLDATFLVAVYRPTLDELKVELAESEAQ